MATYRRYHPPVETLSQINKARIATNSGARPQTVEAVQWHTGEPTLGLTQKWLDYIILDYPDYPWVWNKEDF